jgi:hypothetical protein
MAHQVRPGCQADMQPEVRPGCGAEAHVTYLRPPLISSTCNDAEAQCARLQPPSSSSACASAASLSGHQQLPEQLPGSMRSAALADEPAPHRGPHERMPRHNIQPGQQQGRHAQPRRDAAGVTAHPTAGHGAQGTHAQRSSRRRRKKVRMMMILTAPCCE